MSIKPMLFNTEMVRAILDGIKTCTRRVVRYKYSNTEMKIKKDKYGARLIEIQKDENSDGSTTLTVTEADADALAGQSVKAMSQTPAGLQKLVELIK